MNSDEVHSPTPSALSNLRLGTAPDSWGVWFPDDPRQVPWQQFLDEAAQAGYTAVELGPYGYLPTHPEHLRDELGRRGLILTGATAGTHLHRGGDSLKAAVHECREIAALLAALDAPFLITLPAMYTDLHTGRLVEPAELTDEQWQVLGEGHSELGRVLQEEFGVRQMFHPHADAHVDTEPTIERFLQVTDPDTVSLCLDTGHVAYAGGDNRTIVREHPGRIGYVHLKSVDPDVLRRVRAEGMSFAQAVQHGAMVEPPGGEPEMPPLLADLDALGVPLTAIVEHDMYPAPPGTPLPVETRTCRYYTEQGLGGHRR
ncbi:putative myo-inositol catabolism protein [Streptomyces himastatinicus ATCC 53653]|uniref:Putative myo-inositol catabolism protein n=1 Tax=Streptomyces himastatinicus ATCC 53653 TaxID=457427 RepID=D9WMM3_9ACTN|nr:TIM barrel protein [Streptomyces himastatinicus]EFL27889.1 putative myo-inositol catabolism protein [Streptomyces himastatinicus ATCC 53653]